MVSLLITTPAIGRCGCQIRLTPRPIHARLAPCGASAENWVLTHGGPKARVIYGLLPVDSLRLGLTLASSLGTAQASGEATTALTDLFRASASLRSGQSTCFYSVDHPRQPAQVSGRLNKAIMLLLS